MGVARRGLGPGGLAPGDFLVGNIHIDAVVHGVDGDLVTFFENGDGAAEECFRRDVTDHKPVAATGEAAVGNERDVLAEAHAHHGTGRS